MAEIQQPRFNETLRRLAAMKVGAPSPDLETSIVPVLPLDGLDRPEYAHLGGVKLGFRTVNVAAGGVGTVSVAALFNPVASGMLVIVDTLIFGNNGGTNEDVGILSAATLSALGLGSTSTGGVRDTRGFGEGGIGQSTAASIRSGVTTAAIVTGGFQVNVSGRRPILIPVDIVLGPGFALAFIGTDNTALFRVGWLWRERAANPEELQQ